MSLLLLDSVGGMAISGMGRGLSSWITAARPSSLRAIAEVRWQEQTEERSIEEESELFAFEKNHNLARALQGALAPSLWLVREGNLMWVSSQQQAVMRPVNEVLDHLTLIGNAINERLASCLDERARIAIASWDAHSDRPPVELAEIATRLPQGVIRWLTAIVAQEYNLDGSRDSFQLTEVLAAARLMAGALSRDRIESVITIIATIPKTKTPELDRLSAQAWKQMNWDRPRKPHDEGCALATWFRRTTGKAEAVHVDPGALLSQLGVPVQEFQILDEHLDAIACWGPRHGPAVVLNTAGKHAQSPPGRRATLAHVVSPPYRSARPCL